MLGKPSYRDGNINIFDDFFFNYFISYRFFDARSLGKTTGTDCKASYLKAQEKGVDGEIITKLNFYNLDPIPKTCIDLVSILDSTSDPRLVPYCNTPDI